MNKAKGKITKTAPVEASPPFTNRGKGRNKCETGT